MLEGWGGGRVWLPPPVGGQLIPLLLVWPLPWLLLLLRPVGMQHCYPLRHPAFLCRGTPTPNLRDATLPHPTYRGETALKIATDRCDRALVAQLRAAGASGWKRWVVLDVWWAVTLAFAAWALCEAHHVPGWAFNAALVLGSLEAGLVELGVFEGRGQEGDPHRVPGLWERRAAPVTMALCLYVGALRRRAWPPALTVALGHAGVPGEPLLGFPLVLFLAALWWVAARWLDADDH